MNETIRKAKDHGMELLAKGKLKPALEQFQQVIAKAPTELVARQKVAEILVKLGRGKEAVPHYEALSDAYARGGQFFKAIALCKVILQLDPAHSSTQDNLTKLYSATRQPTRGLPPPRDGAPAPAAAPVLPTVARPSPEERPSGPPVLGFVPPPPPAAALAPPPLPIAAFAPPPPPPPDDAGGDEVILEVEADAGIVLEVEPPQAPELPKIPLFSELTPVEFKAVLAGAVEARVFADGDAIVSEGQMGDAMYAICQGDVSVRRQLQGQPAREVATMKEGDIFGEIGLVLGGPRLATVVAKGEVIALEFHRSAMDTVLKKHPGVGQAIDRFYRERLLQNLLRASPVFRPLSQDAKEQLAKEFEPLTYDSGEVLILQGSTGDGLYLLLRGTCEVIDVSGERYPDLHEGAHFGEISVLLDKPATATVRAASKVTVLKLAASVFKEKVLSHPEVKQHVVTMARERLERTKELQSRGFQTELV